MSDSVILDSQSLDATGGSNPTATTDAVRVTGSDKLVAVIEGDSSSSDITVTAQIKLSTNGEWIHWETDSNQNLTSFNNNADSFPYTVEAVGYQFRLKLENNSASSTTVTVRKHESHDS